MNCIQKARLELMYNNLKLLYQQQRALKSKNMSSERYLGEVDKLNIRILMKKEQIKQYKKEIGL